MTCLRISVVCRIPRDGVGSWLIISAMMAFASVAPAADLRVLPPGQLPSDVRLLPLKDLNGYFPFLVPPTRQAWEKRAAQLRRQMLVSLGLWPMPAKQPLEPVIHGLIDQGDYTVEKVYFESLPGFYVTGSLYRPKGQGGKRPGVLCPHGHWANGRFYDCGEKNVRKQIVEGAERFENGGRSPMQSRCVQLARMGCVVFHWDMIGYADSQQIPSSVIHGFKKQRPEMNRPENWGLFSPQAESRFQSPMGLQSFNSIRALDFLLSLPSVDKDRIAVTGASGGGTQTFILCAIDPRPSVAVPAVMVSTAMQGGCTCENACDLRIGTSNVEFAALFAPKPLGLTAAHDWTVEMETKGFPELVQLYKLYGAPKNVMLKPLLHFGHNYNYVSRAAVYTWLNKHLRLGWPEPVVEEDYPRLTAKELTVWDENHPQPEGGPELERRVLAWWTADATRQLAALHPSDAASLEHYRQIVGGGWDVVLGRRLPEPASVSFQGKSTVAGDRYDRISGLLTHQLTSRQAMAIAGDLDASRATEQLPVILLKPKKWNGRACVMAFASGKRDLFGSDGTPTAAVKRLLDAGVLVCSADLFMQGEFLKSDKPLAETRRVANPREAAAYTFGYNRALFARRVHDLLSVIAYLRGGPSPASRIDIVGLQGAGPWVAAARAQAGSALTAAAIDSAGFRFAYVTAIHHPSFLPGGAKYDDLPGLLALGAPAPLWLAGEGGALPPVVDAAYQAASARNAVQLYSGDSAGQMDSAAKWLLEVRP